jgi:CRISPR type IV-associated protein Csf3
MRAPEAPIHLDALIAWAAVFETGGQTYEAQDHLPLEKYTAASGKWTWKASQLVYNSGHRQSIPLTRRLDVDECARDQTDGVFRANNLNVLTPGTGVYKSYNFMVPIVAVDVVHAWCVGEEKTIERLLSHVRHVGKLGRIDYGRIKKWTVTIDDEPNRERWRLRTMPDSHDGYNATIGTLSPPYWERARRTEAWQPSSDTLSAALSKLSRVLR